MKNSAIRLVLLMLLLSASGLLKASGEIADTSYNFLFNVNMTKAIQDGLFDPDSDKVYVDFQESIPDLLLLQGSNRVFSGIIQQGLDSGVTYHFSYRINDTVVESVSRQVTAAPGLVQINSWWNDEYLNTTTFRVLLTGLPDSVFNFGTDTLQILGDMTDWEPVGIPPIDSTANYDISFHLDPSLIYSYTFRIKHDSSFTYEEFAEGYRMFMPPDTIITVEQYFNNQDSTKILLTLVCHMTIQEELGNFDPATDFLDVAGNFNNWGAWDILYDPFNTGSYTVSKMFDRSLIGGDPVEFKFRINGSWATAELDSLDPRSYVLQPSDSNGNPNRYVCWYNNVGPVVPGPPWATDLYIQGLLEVKQVLSGSYLYHNLSGIPEGNSLYKWYRADSVGAPLVAIDSAWTINYTTDSIADLGKFLVFEVTPVAASGEDTLGLPVQVYTTGKIGAVGIEELEENPILLYPNPAESEIFCEGRFAFRKVEIYTLMGQLVYSSQVPGMMTRFRMDVSALPTGMYLLKAYSRDHLPAAKRFIKR